mmetsp:Transcript_13455/g.35790  ORF Transcript_13455/g.35790 Transcript_13455/m.35790 type:complete len:100 (+) Transcript_13455:979-1278(+)
MGGGLLSTALSSPTAGGLAVAWLVPADSVGWPLAPASTPPSMGHSPQVCGQTPAMVPTPSGSKTLRRAARVISAIAEVQPSPITASWLNMAAQVLGESR